MNSYLTTLSVSACAFKLQYHIIFKHLMNILLCYWWWFLEAYFCICPHTHLAFESKVFKIELRKIYDALYILFASLRPASSLTLRLGGRKNHKSLCYFPLSNISPACNSHLCIILFIVPLVVVWMEELEQSTLLLLYQMPFQQTSIKCLPHLVFCIFSSSLTQHNSSLYNHHITIILIQYE